MRSNVRPFHKYFKARKDQKLYHHHLDTHNHASSPIFGELFLYASKKECARDQINEACILFYAWMTVALLLYIYLYAYGILNI